MGEIMPHIKFLTEKGEHLSPIDVFKGLLWDKYFVVEISEESDVGRTTVVVAENKNECYYNKSLINKIELKDELKYIKEEYYQHKLSFSEKVIIDKVFNDIYKVIENE